MAPDYSRTTDTSYYTPYTSTTSTTDYDDGPNVYIVTGHIVIGEGKCELEKFIERELLDEMMEGWFSRKPEIKAVRRRPEIRLRGVRLDGRGWAI